VKCCVILFLLFPGSCSLRGTARNCLRYLNFIYLFFECAHLNSQKLNTCRMVLHYMLIREFRICTFNLTLFQLWSRDSVDGIATRYGLEGPGIEYRWGEIFRTYPDRLRGPPSLLYSGYRVFPGGKGGRCVMLTTHPLLVPRLRKS
jgi:hypothetical protein